MIAILNSCRKRDERFYFLTAGDGDDNMNDGGGGGDGGGRGVSCGRNDISENA